MNDESMTQLVQLLNEWWEQGSMPEEALKARVVLIYKKGDASLCENYRPISLLNTVYKILASIIHKRIEDGIDHALQETQYGFRKNRGTREALYNIRRVITAGESSKTKTFLLLLDWAKAFDKISHEGLISALRRMSIPEKIVTLIADMYSKATFFVEIEGIRSHTYAQETGIRQGCPLSPYLFLIVMTVMFHDINQSKTDAIRKNRVNTTNFDEIMFADDTICISENAKALTQLLQIIQREGQKYGMLNTDKCELIRIARNNDLTEKDVVKFSDGKIVNMKNEAKYLGCQLNNRGDPGKEVRQRIATCMTILKKLDIYWLKANPTPKNTK